MTSRLYLLVYQNVDTHWIVLIAAHCWARNCSPKNRILTWTLTSRTVTSKYVKWNAGYNADNRDYDGKTRFEELHCAEVDNFRSRGYNRFPRADEWPGQKASLRLPSYSLWMTNANFAWILSPPNLYGVLLLTTIIHTAHTIRNFVLLMIMVRNRPLVDPVHHSTMRDPIRVSGMI